MRFSKLMLVPLALLSVVVAACGRAPNLSAPSVPDPADGAIEAEATKGPISVFFNDAYGERIDINEPKARRYALNTDKPLFALIRGAKHSLDGCFYDVEDMDVAKALVAAKARGVKVRIVTDTDGMVDKTDPSKPRPAIEALKAAGIQVVDDQRSGIMHHKFLVVDGNQVWNGSTNLTPTSLYCHNNNAMVFKSAAVASAYEGEFERLFVKREFGRSTRRNELTSVTPIKLNGATIRIFFSPSGGGRSAVVQSLGDAKKSIRFLTFSLTDVETGEVMLAKAKSGVKVEGVFDRWLAAGQYSLFDTFKRANINVLKDGNEALMHHKVLLIDSKTVITGSYNYSQNAELNNNEAFMIIENAPAISAAFNREFQKVQRAAKVNRPPAFEKPDPEHKSGEGP